MKNYKNIFENIQPSENLIEQTIEKATKSTKIAKSTLIKPAFAYICVILLFLMPVVANEIDRIYRIMTLVSPEIAKDFTPIEQSNVQLDDDYIADFEDFTPTNEPIYVENNDIRLEIVSINIENNVAKLYITLQDLKGNRIDETINLEKFSIDGIETSALGSEFLGFNQGQATFMITITDFENENILNSTTEQINFSITEFTTMSTSWGKDEKFYVDVNISDIISQKSDTKEVFLVGASGYYIEHTGKEVFSEPCLVLNPNITPVSIGDFNVEIIACSYIDEKLHIQTREMINNDYNESYSYLYLQKNEQNEDINAIYAVSFADFSENYKFLEYVFDLPFSELHEHKILAFGMSDSQTFLGNLSVSFNLTEF